MSIRLYSILLAGVLLSSHALSAPAPQLGAVESLDTVIPPSLAANIDAAREAAAKGSPPRLLNLVRPKPVASFAPTNQTTTAAAASELERVQSVFTQYKTAFPDPLPAPHPIPGISKPNEGAPLDGIVLAIADSESCTASAEGMNQIYRGIIKTANDAGVSARVYVNPSVARQCKQSFRDLRVEWIDDYTFDSMWIRDYGPGGFFKNQKTTIADPVYVRGGGTRYKDDALPKNFAQHYNLPLAPIQIAFEWGNFISDASGTCIVSDIVLKNEVVRSYKGKIASASDKTILSYIAEAESRTRTAFRSILGCDRLIILEQLVDYATGHIDMFLAHVEEKELVMGQYTEAQDPVNARIQATNRARLESYGFKITSVPMPSNCPRSGNTTPNSCNNVEGYDRIWRSYTNVLQIQDRVVLPVYKEHDVYQRKAIEAWEKVAGGKYKGKVVTVAADVIIPNAGAVHCISQAIPKSV